MRQAKEATPTSTLKWYAGDLPRAEREKILAIRHTRGTPYHCHLRAMIRILGRFPTCSFFFFFTREDHLFHIPSDTLRVHFTLAHVHVREIIFRKIILVGFPKKSAPTIQILTKKVFARVSSTK